MININDYSQREMRNQQMTFVLFLLLTFTLFGCSNYQTTQKRDIPKEAYFGGGEVNYSLSLADSIRHNNGVLYLVIDKPTGTILYTKANSENKRMVKVPIPNRSVVRLLDVLFLQSGSEFLYEIKHRGTIGYVRASDAKAPQVQLDLVENLKQSAIQSFDDKKSENSELQRIRTQKLQYESNPMYIIASMANIRADHTTSSAIITQVPRGTMVYVQDTNDGIRNWYKVKYREKDIWSRYEIEEGEIDTEQELNALYVNGWIHRSLLSKRKPPETVNNYEVYNYLQKRWDYYEAKDGAYLDKHDDLVIAEASDKFGITQNQVLQIHQDIEFEKSGLKRQESVYIDQQNVAVDIRVVQVKYQNNMLEVTLENRTKKAVTLPKINLTCYAISASGAETGYNIIWVENLGYGQTKTYSRVATRTFQRVKLIGYMNIDKIRAAGLRSKIQESNDYGETVIPVFKTGIIRL